MSKSIFSCEHFLALDGDELIDYAEPFVTTQVDKVPDSVYETLLDRLGGLGDIHTVYTLEICMRIDPKNFVSHAIEFLSHSDSSVCCTACRLIESLPKEFIADDLVKKIAETPIVDLFSLHIRSGERIRIGTNEEFIRTLVTRFSD